MKIMRAMLSNNRLGAVACLISLLGQPLGAMASDETAPVDTAFLVEDVSLDDDGLLLGTVSTEAGEPIPDADVEIVFAGAVVASTQTEADGSFRVAGLREGVHDIRSGSTTASYRLWRPETAPPQVEEVAHVSCCDEYPPLRRPDPPRRGPLRRAFACYPLATTLLVGAGLGAAIAIPIATSQKPASP
jgi:hypothetical protein